MQHACERAGEVAADGAADGACPRELALPNQPLSVDLMSLKAAHR